MAYPYQPSNEPTADIPEPVIHEEHSDVRNIQVAPTTREPVNNVLSFTEHKIKTLGLQTFPSENPFTPAEESDLKKPGALGKTLNMIMSELSVKINYKPITNSTQEFYEKFSNYLSEIISALQIANDRTASQSEAQRYIDKFKSLHEYGTKSYQDQLKKLEQIHYLIAHLASV